MRNGKGGLSLGFTFDSALPSRHARRAVCAVALTYICVLLTGCTEPTEPTQSIEIAGAWAPALPPNATTGAVYMKITAHEPDRLVTASSAIAHSVEVHQTILEDGIAKMRPLESVALEAHESIAFEPGGAHFMLMGLTEPLEIGNTVELELHFEHAGVVTVRAPVMAPDGDHTDH